jgi:hypothetical protein
MVGADLLTKMGGYLKQIAAGGLNLLKALLLLAMLGPDMLDGIIDLLVNVGMMLLNALIRAIPVVVNAIAKWLPVIINLITDLIPVLLNSLITTFASLANNKDLPGPLQLFFKGLEMLTRAVKWITENLWILIPILALVAAAYAVMIAVQLGQIAMKVIEALVYIAVNIELIVAIGLLALLVIGIILLVAAFIALYVWADEIAEWFESLWDQFKNLSTGMKIFIAVLALMFLPVTLVIAAIYGLVKVMQFFKHGGLDKIKSGLKDAGNAALDFNKKVNETKKKLMDVGGKLFDSLKDAHSMADVGKAIKDAIMGGIDAMFGDGTAKKAMEWFQDIFKSIKQWAKAHGLGVLFGEEAQGTTSGEHAWNIGTGHNETIRAVQHSLGDNDATKDYAENVYKALSGGPKDINNMLTQIKEHPEQFGNFGPQLEQFLIHAKEQIKTQEDGNAYLKKIANAAEQNPTFSLVDAAKINLR